MPTNREAHNVYLWGKSPSPTNHAFYSTECYKNAPNTVAPNTATKPKNAPY